jgi:ADP-ribose pyrophosphatase
MVVPVREDGRIILVNQYRYLCERESLEFPCGSVKEGDTYRDTANMELKEETGFGAPILDEVGTFAPYNGVASEICKVYIARELTKSEAEPDRTEEFELVYCTPGEIDDLISKNDIWDGMTLAAWIMARTKI